MKKAFTLIELMAVIVIISLIALLTFPNIINQIKRTKKSTNKMVEDIVLQQTKNYVHDNPDEFKDKKYCFSIQTLVDKNYIKEGIVKSNQFVDNKVIYITTEGDFKYEVVDKDKCNTYDYVDNEGNGYNEVEYIEATGEQYIDTEYVFKTKPKVVGDIMITSSNDLDIMGTNTAQEGCFIIDFAIGNKNIYYRYSSSSFTSTNPNIDAYEWHSFEFSDKVVIDDNQKLLINSYDFSNNNKTFMIGKGRNFGYARFKGVTMYDDEKLVREFIPVYRVTDNKGGVFDLINKKFYASKTNKDFYYNKDEKKEIPTVDEELEYIETTGAQYIDTGYVFKNKPKVISEIMLMSIQDLDIMGNNNVASGNFIIDFAGNNLYYRYSQTNYKNINTGIKIYSWYNVEFSDKVIINGVEKDSVDSYNFSNNTQTFLIGKGRNYSYAKFKEIKMYDGDELVRDLVPYYKKSVNKVGMLDKVHNVFYENQGTGEFLWG